MTRPGLRNFKSQLVGWPALWVCCHSPSISLFSVTQEYPQVGCLWPSPCRVFDQPCLPGPD